MSKGWILVLLPLLATIAVVACVVELILGRERDPIDDFCVEAEEG